MINKLGFLILALLSMVTLVGAATNTQVTSSALPLTGGSITPNGLKFFSGDANYTITVEPGWSISSVKIDNVDTGAPYGTTYSIPFVSGSVHTIKVTFVQTTYSITTSAGPGGLLQITGGGSTGILAGSNRAVIVAPSSGYMIHSYIVDNGTPVVPADLTVPASISFNNITANHTASATFDLIPMVTAYAGVDQTIVIRPSGGASITLVGTTTSNMGATTYQWNVTDKPTGANATFGNAVGKTTMFSVDKAGMYKVILTITSGGVIVTSAPATITVQAASITCDNNGSVTITEVQSAISMFLGLKTVAACVDINGDTNVSSAEVQKVLNGYLGL